MTISPQQKPLNSGFSNKPEPEEVLQGVDLNGKVALVTGGYSGIGLETVRALVNAGVHVHVPARDKKRAAEALAGILPEDCIGLMDLGDVASVERFADDFASRHNKLDLLIANAGVMACPEQHTPQGWEWQLAVNHFGHFTLTTRLLDCLARADGARVVTLSSSAHRISGIHFDDVHFAERPYEKWSAYGQSKSAQALMAVGLDARASDRGIRALTVHPGGIFTPLQRHLPQEEMVALGWLGEDGKPSELVLKHFKTPTQGASTTLWAATSPQLADIGGVFCEDCDIARQVPADEKGFFGVRPWAVDREDAERLWQLTETTLATA